MAILNYTTSIDCEKSIAEIQKILVKRGAQKIVTDYQGEMPVSVTFCIVLNGKMVGFSLPANSAGVLKATVYQEAQKNGINGMLAIE